ncbi:MAG: Holliday junction branch migration protein RuvA [Hydrogenoanaerobacterium sp.]
MIYSLRGKLLHTEAGLAVIECGGVGYACKTTATTLALLKKEGGEVTLFTYLHVTENALDLFGFATSAELNFFKLIITVSGVGPKAGLAILSDHSPDRLSLCIAAGDYKTLTQTSGIGNKIAQRIVLELKDKVTAMGIEPQGGADTMQGRDFTAGAVGDAVNALTTLGYSRSEAAAALAPLGEGLTAEELIKGGLKALSSHKN